MHLTEVVQSRDTRTKHLRMMEAMAAEIRDLFRRGTFKTVMRAETPPNASVLIARVLLEIKHKITGDVRFKARNVIGYIEIS